MMTLIVLGLYKYNQIVLSFTFSFFYIKLLNLKN